MLGTLGFLSFGLRLSLLLFANSLSFSGALKSGFFKVDEVGLKQDGTGAFALKEDFLFVVLATIAAQICQCNGGFTD